MDSYYKALYLRCRAAKSRGDADELVQLYRCHRASKGGWMREQRKGARPASASAGRARSRADLRTGYRPRKLPTMRHSQSAFLDRRRSDSFGDASRVPCPRQSGRGYVDDSSINQSPRCVKKLEMRSDESTFCWSA
eukprot:scaffold5502_cov115-Pinguiococcus_pyrenoidosus.AAC.1